eukprot:Phypoly_transcript_03504.p1 GENE.Phypoly_transcript_03504~~Phypoly_transcript_03504.p1  ORF type:complete len:605 (+),score=91.66 Phypoly_transcript_03504:512-2326(+)
MLQDPYNGSDREYLSEYGNPEDEYIPPPSVVTRNVVLEGQLNIWNELRRFDQSNTGLITAQDFKQALDNLGIAFGSKAADKILVLMKFTPDGYIDYLKLGEEVENFMRAYGAPKVPKRDTERLFMVTPRLTTDPEPLADDSFQQRRLSMKDKVFSVQDRIYEAFCKYERNEISSEIFLDILNELDLQPSAAVIKVLRRRDEMGTCSYANLLQALCLPESHYDMPQVSPVRAPFTNPSRSPITDTGPAPPIKPRLLNLPPSLRDSNVITWSDDPKKEKIPSKAMQTRVMVCDDVVKTPSRFVIDTLENENVPIELAATKQEKIFALVRDFIEGATDGMEFRIALRDMGIDINRELERLIGGHERGGQVTFQDFIKYLGMYHEGDVRYQFSEERVDPRATLNLFQAVNIERPESPSRDHLPRYIKGTGDVITWNNAFLEQERPKSPTKRFDESADFAVWDTPPVPVTTISVQQVDAHGRPFTPKRHYSHANSSRVSELLQWENQQQQLDPNSPTYTNGTSDLLNSSPSSSPQPQRRDPNRRTSYRINDTANILTWENATEPPPTNRVRTPDKTHATLPNGVIHPKAPFGTDRDVYYNINPHRPNGR